MKNMSKLLLVAVCFLGLSSILEAHSTTKRAAFGGALIASLVGAGYFGKKAYRAYQNLQEIRAAAVQDPENPTLQEARGRAMAAFLVSLGGTGLSAIAAFFSGREAMKDDAAPAGAPVSSGLVAGGNRGVSTGGADTWEEDEQLDEQPVVPTDVVPTRSSAPITSAASGISRSVASTSHEPSAPPVEVSSQDQPMAQARLIRYKRRLAEFPEKAEHASPDEYRVLAAEFEEMERSPLAQAANANFYAARTALKILEARACLHALEDKIKSRPDALSMEEIETVKGGDLRVLSRLEQLKEAVRGQNAKMIVVEYRKLISQAHSLDSAGLRQQRSAKEAQLKKLFGGWWNEGVDRFDQRTSYYISQTPDLTAVTEELEKVIAAKEQEEKAPRPAAGGAAAVDALLTAAERRASEIHEDFARKSAEARAKINHDSHCRKIEIFEQQMAGRDGGSLLFTNDSMAKGLYDDIEKYRRERVLTDSEAASLVDRVNKICETAQEAWRHHKKNELNKRIETFEAFQGEAVTTLADGYSLNALRPVIESYRTDGIINPAEASVFLARLDNLHARARAAARGELQALPAPAVSAPVLAASASVSGVAPSATSGVGVSVASGDEGRRDRKMKFF